MKKRNIILLFATCIISLCFFGGLLVYAFELQLDKDKQNDLDKQKSNISMIKKEPTKAPEIASDKNTSNQISSPGKKNNISKVTVTPKPSSQPKVNNKKEEQPIILDFAGDINFDESSQPITRYDSKKKGILGGLSSDLVAEMKAADLMMLNNEFSYSTRGTKAANKSYTFRANPKRVEILKEMGVDIVSLANNHTLDYGPDALKDTFQTLENAKIDYIGAGINMARAKAPVYYTLGNKKIAYVAASRVVFSTDWYATDTKLGMIGTYDPTLYIKSIKEAAAHSDFVVAYLHWGVERKSQPEPYQRLLAKQYIDAGADFVVGCHPHVLQGFEYYKGKPIAYSLGNFWFNSAYKDTGLLKLYLDTNGTARLQILPAKSENAYTYFIKDSAKKAQYYKTMENISYGVTIDKNGFIKEK